MKARFWTITVSLLWSISLAYSQPIKNIGLKAGLAFTNQAWKYSFMDSDLPTKTRLGLDIGIAVEWLKDSPVTIMTELHFVQKGMKDELIVTTEQYPNGTGQTIAKQPRVDYLSIPLMAKYTLRFNTIAICAVAGLRYDLFVSSAGEGFELVIDKFRKSELGGSFGCGAEFTSPFDRTIGLEFRYSPTFQKSYSSQFLTVSNQSMELLVGIML